MLVSKMELEDKPYHHILIQEGAQTADSFGIEVELEGVGFGPVVPQIQAWWAYHHDNSLRKFKPGDETIEFVSRSPQGMKTIQVAVNKLFTLLNGSGVKVYESYRTSIHVHVNCSQETYRTIYNFMTLSLILDELLTSQNGEHRIGNNFCLRAKDAMGQVVSLINSIQGRHNFYGIPQNDRYSSINFAALNKFGSIEFRSLECTTHEGRLMHWIGTLNHIKQMAKTFKNPVEVVQQFSVKGPEEFLEYVLGPFAIKYLRVPDFETMLFNGARIAQDLAYCSAWKES